MPDVSQEDLEKKRAKNQKLREQILEAESSGSERLAAKEREVTGLQLDAETARLEAQLAEAKEAAKVSTIKDGASAVIAQVDAEKSAAEAAKDSGTAAANVKNEG